MDKNEQLIQDPPPGKRMVKFCGDTVVFTLSLPQPQNGSAWVRTNIGQAQTIRREIIRQVEQDETPLGRAWFDIPMKPIDERTFTATLPLCESGHFEAKCFFLPQNETTPLWPAGTNTVLNVDSADACCANNIYNAFVRQFGPNKAGAESANGPDQEFITHLDHIGYTVIPPSGTFRDLIGELDFILGELGFRILMLLPIHPTPTTYGRMGRFGSPYAALSFTTVDPALAEFDHHATPLEQFVELVDAVHLRHARVFIDIAINHTGWAANLHESHPQWLVRGPEGKIEVPGAWGVNWEDLTKLDYSRKDLWQYMANVFLTWCSRGVDGFRCDAGYMIPAVAWRYIIAKVRHQYPDTVFLLEGLGGKISVTRDLLNTANLNWAYSELFQNYDRAQIENYLPQSIDIAASDGIAVHFAETHDNPRLAARSQVYARMRTALCALLSDQGAYGFANGVEWYAAEKINVHNSPSLNWGSPVNQVDRIRRLNHLLKTLPVFRGPTETRMIQEDGGNYLVLLRRHSPSGSTLLVVVNLDDENQTTAAWNPAAAGSEGPDFIDLLSETGVSVSESNGRHTCLLEPGQVLCLTQDESDRDSLRQLPDGQFWLPPQVEIQRLRAKAFEVFSFYHGPGDLADDYPEHLAAQLKEDPLSFCQTVNSLSSETRVVTWQWPRDLRRQVMLPPGYFLMLRADHAFHARLDYGPRTVACENSLPKANGSFFALFLPQPPPETARSYGLKLTVFEPDGNRHADGSVLALAEPANTRVKRIFQRPELLSRNLTFIDTNGRGGMLRIPVSWGRLTSRYDSLLAANIDTDVPEDRWIMLSHCRVWLVYQGYSQALNTDCLEAFEVDDDTGGTWRYHIPTGQGEDVIVKLGLKMVAGENAVQLTLYRQPHGEVVGRLEDSKPVQLILRPDIENRNFHQTTKAYLGPENEWPQKVSCTQREFRFSPDADHSLRMQISEGEFIAEPEWQYMAHRAMDADRGLDSNSDLFSPGYFTVFLAGDQQVTLAAEIVPTPEAPSSENIALPRRLADPVESDATGRDTPRNVLTRALDDFVVRRGELKSVIAGYPWFLDWGRDALIFVRGLIAAGKLDDARMILKQFGRFEQHGTLPNMIHADDAGNRDTSDAPLWFIQACGELIETEKADDFLEEGCGGRTIRQILLSIGQAYRTQTSNGIYMDPDTGLIFSPVHFTWMDTAHPAGTPRQGYPIEIQALWVAALEILAAVDRKENRNQWRQLSATVQSSILNLFWSDDLGFLADCLHASSGQSAGQAVADDALRPNQLLAITLGAVGDRQICRRILAACEELLVPGGIRSLADRRVGHPIEIVHHNQVLNDPHHPYQGTYAGDEDTRRKPAYHNGTAWTWPFPSFCEAWALSYGTAGRDAALAWLSSGMRLLESGCLGHIPEIMDGNAPHTPRGCDAQAWGASELLRVWLKLTATDN
jgi:starch synthase (maltosyl-transferring)